MSHYDPDECLDAASGDCAGETSFWPALSGSGMNYPRCEFHRAADVERLTPVLADIRRRYPEHRPADFDETFAGERWDED
jgi:hypothetical protein